MTYNPARGGAATLYGVVSERHQEALRENRGLETVSLPTDLVGASNWHDPDSGSRIQLTPRPRSGSWIMNIRESEGLPRGLKITEGVNYLDEPLRVVVDRLKTSVATRECLLDLGHVSIEALCEMAERMQPLDYSHSSTLGQAMNVGYSLRRTPEGLERLSLGSAAQTLIRASIYRHRANPSERFITVEQAENFGDIVDGCWKIRTQAWMDQLSCSLVLEATTDDRLAISPGASVLVAVMFPHTVEWGTLDGPVVDDALPLLVEGNDVLVPMESVPAGFSHLDQQSLGRLQEIFDHARVVPIIPEG